MSGEPWVVWVRGLASGRGVAGAQRPHRVESHPASIQQVQERLRPTVGPTGGTLPPWVRSALPGAPSVLCVLGVQMAVTMRGCPCEFPFWKGTFPGRGVHRRQNS